MTTPSTQELLARMLDPRDPSAALRQEILDASVEHLVHEAAKWLRDGERLPEDLEDTISMVVKAQLTPSN